MISNEQGLLLRLCAAQAEAKNGLGAEVDLATDEAVLPVGVDGEGVGQEADPALVIGATDEDGLGVCAGLEGRWGPLEARGRGLPVGPGI